MKILPALMIFTFLITPYVTFANDDSEQTLEPLIDSAEEKIIYETDKAVKISVGGTTGFAYSDNIYRTENDEESDIIAVFRPGVRVRTDLEPYQLDVQALAEAGEYLQESENSYVDTDLKGRLGYDFTPNTNVYVGARHQFDHIPVGAFTDDPNTQSATPTEYRYMEAYGGVKLDMPSWIAHLHTGIDFYDYDNTNRRDGTLINNDDRDRDEMHLTQRVGYKVHPDAVLFVQGTYNQRNYDNRVDGTLLFSRDSDGIEGLAGIKIGEDRDPIYLEMAAGYLQQNYNEDVLTDVNGVALRGELGLNPNDDLRIRGVLSRDVRESIIAGSSAYLQTRIGAQVNYQMTQEWLLGSKAGFTLNDFKINPAAGGTPRNDYIADASMFADYNFYEDYFIGGEYQFLNRNSTEVNRDYASNVFLVRLGVAY